VGKSIGSRGLLYFDALGFLVRHRDLMAAIGPDHIAAIRKRQKLVTLFSAFQTRPGDGFCDFHGLILCSDDLAHLAHSALKVI
jgi:hypothetical protein